MIQKTINILLVEDDPGDARLIQEMLVESTRERLALNHASKLAEALACLSQERYDTILLDLSLPDSHGIDTLLQMEAEETDTPIIVLTGNEDESLGVEAVQMGAQDYLIKGDVSSRLLIRSIRYAIERHRAEMKLRRSEAEYRSLIDDVFDTSMVAVLILDSDFRVVWCNEATEIYFAIERERLLGRDKRKLIDDDLKCLFADPDDYAARLLKAYEEGAFTDRFECRVTPEGERTERWLEHWSQPIRDGMYTGGRIEQYTDITERKKLEFAEREQREFAEAMREISTLLTSSLDLNDVLSSILANLGEVVPHDLASITIMEDDHFQIAQTHTRGKQDTQHGVITEKRLKLDYEHYNHTMYETQRPIRIPDMQRDKRLQSAAVDANIHAYVGAPIQLQDEVIGFINLLSEKTDFFSPEHTERLVAFTKLAAIAIQNARLFDQSKKLATYEERQRLARELHDSVSQTLFTCRTMSETALRRWKKDPARAHELMKDVNQLTTMALAEMRILLLELRPTALTKVGLKQLFEQYFQPIQDRREFTLLLTIEDIPNLPPEVQIVLYRIAQEALNNIDKHANASKVEVKAINQPGQVILEIRDDGKGFEIDDIAATSFGLGIMRERANEIGASIEITSKVDQGHKLPLSGKRTQRHDRHRHHSTHHRRRS